MIDARAVGWDGLLRMVPFLSKSTLEEEIRLGRFPKPRQFSARRVGWLVREVDEWIEGRPLSNLAPPPNTGAPKPRRRLSDASSQSAQGEHQAA